MLNTINRTGKVLDLFTATDPEWGVTDVAKALDLPISTAFDIVASLAEIGLLQQSYGERYRLGWRLLAISRRLVNSTCFDAHAHRTIAGLAKHLDAVVTIGAWDGHGVVCVATASSTPVGHGLQDGAHIPGHASALGKLLMAQLPWAKVEERITRYGLPALTPASVTDSDLLRTQLASIRRQEFAVDHSETIAGQSCVAVAINQRLRTIGALSICIPSDKIIANQEQLVQVARRAVRTLQQQGMR